MEISDAEIRTSTGQTCGSGKSEIYARPRPVGVGELGGMDGVCPWTRPGGAWSGAEPERSVPVACASAFGTMNVDGERDVHTRPMTDRTRGSPWHTQVV